MKLQLISIEKLKKQIPRRTVKKSKLNFLSYLFVLKLVRETLQTPSLKKEKEKHELKAKLLAQIPVIQYTSIRTIDISSYMFYKNYYEATILANLKNF